MKRILMMLVCVALFGTVGYLGYEHLKMKSTVDTDIQVASSSATQGSEVSSSEAVANDLNEREGSNSQDGEEGKSESYTKGYLAGVEIGKEDNRIGYIGQATPGGTDDAEYVRGWTDGRKATNKPGLSEQKDDEIGFHGTAKEYIEAGNNGTIIKSMTPEEVEKVRKYNETGEMPK